MKVGKLEPRELAMALDDAAAIAEAIVLIADLAEEDDDVRQKLPAIERAIGRLLQRQLTELAKEVDDA